jgi:DNA-binding MarR family transcriptional regulator
MTEWLDPDQQRRWRAWIAAATLLTERLSRELQASHGLSMADYEILVRLSEAEGRRLRMSTLANSTMASRSRLTHQIDRMVKAGLVRREACPQDGRGQHAVMTDVGWDKLVSAAPDHVASVRQHMVNILSPEQFAALGDASARLAEALEEPSECTESTESVAS